MKDMNAPKSPRFKIGSEAEAPDKVYQEELQDLRVEKLSHRVTLLTILIPCLIGVILLITYVDIKDRVIRSQTTGSQSLQELSQDVSSKFSQLSLKEAKLEEAVSQDLPDLKNNLAVIQTRLRTAQKAIVEMRSIMADKNKVEKALVDIHQELDPLPKKVESVAAYVQTVEDKLSQEMHEVNVTIEAIQNTLLKIETDLIALAAAKVDKEALEATLKEERKALQSDLAKSIKGLEKSINALDRRVNALSAPEATSAPPKPPQSAAPPPATKPQTTPKPPTETKPSPQTVPAPQPGKIVEQNIE